MNDVKQDAEGFAPTWVFEHVPRMGGATGEAYTNTLASSGMPPAAVLAREAIQNSVDAMQPKARKVEMHFVFRDLIGEAKKAFVDASGISQLTPRVPKLNLKEPNCILTIDASDQPMRLLYIDDRKTTGLEGDFTDPDSKFFKLLLSMGDGGKQHDEHGTGGSYGFGKSVYSSSSSIQSIFAYSRTKDDNGVPRSIFFGCGYFKKHKFGYKIFQSAMKFNTYPVHIHTFTFSSCIFIHVH